MKIPHKNVERIETEKRNKFKIEGHDKPYFLKNIVFRGTEADVVEFIQNGHTVTVATDIFK